MIFTDLCERVAADLARKGYAGRTIGIKLRYDDFRIATRDVTIEHATADARVIRQAAGLGGGRAGGRAQKNNNTNLKPYEEINV